MPYFDFHLHTTLKSFFSTGNKKLNPWEPVPAGHIPLKLCKDLAAYLLQTQCNLRQLSNSGCNLFGYAFFFPDTAMVDNKTVKALAKRMPDEFDAAFMDDIINKRFNPYRVALKHVNEVLFNPARFGITDVQVLTLSHPNNYETDPKKLFLFFVVEGCHSLSSTQETDSFDVDDMLTNLDDLRSRFLVFSLNLTHIENSKICNQAYGMQFETDSRFRPFQKGIGADGWKMLQHCYTRKILIDIKHMSLAARLELYAEWFDNASSIAAVRQPIICTHAGFTGISWTEVADYAYKISKTPEKGSVYMSVGKPYTPLVGLSPSFNASSINLYDEDIESIILSGGIVGLNLDRRILGYQQPGSPTIEMPDSDFPFDEEYISEKELYLFYNAGNKDRVSSKLNEEHCITWERVEEGSTTATEKEYHLLHFLMHVAHFIKVAATSLRGIDVNKALTQICIGSDFDGLIHPIWCCLNTEELHILQSEFEKRFVKFANDINTPLPPGFDIKKFSQQLFFENGSNFIFGRLPLLVL